MLKPLSFNVSRHDFKDFSNMFLFDDVSGSRFSIDFVNCFRMLTVLTAFKLYSTVWANQHCLKVFLDK